MSNFLKCIIGFIFFSIFFNTNAKEIKIDTTFSSIDIYNTLKTAYNSDTATTNSVQQNLAIKNISGKAVQLYLSIINPTIDKITIKETSKKEVVLGDLLPFIKRTFKHSNFIYPIFLAKDSSCNLTIKVYNNVQHKVNFRINLANENTFIRITNHDYFFNGIFYGIFFMFLLLLICFYIFSRSNFFIIYLVINCFMLLLIMQYNGNGNQFVWFYSSAIQKYIVFFAVVGYLTAHILFIRTFFAPQFSNDYSNSIFKFFLLVMALVILLILFQLYNRSYGYSYSNLYNVIISSIFLLYGMIVLALCIYTYIESKRREVIWVFIGMFFHLINWILFINNEFSFIAWVNYLDNFKLFSSNIFVPQLNYYITLLEMFVITVFIAVNYHNLIRQNNLSSQRLEFLQKRNVNTFVIGQEEEREKITHQIEQSIAKDIEHLKDSLAKISIQNDAKKIVPTVQTEITSILADIKNITGNYVAPDIQQMNLETLIITSTDKLFYHINTVYDFSNIPTDYKLNAISNINIYRVFQEISNNTIKHSKAENVKISAIKDTKTLQIKIFDDGIGFSSTVNQTAGIGLLNIESRISSLNGNFYLMSNEKTGTTIHLIIPLKEIV